MAKRLDHRWHSECRLLRWRGVLRWKVHLEYPHLHDHHNDLPLALEKLQIRTEWLSDYAKSFGIRASRVANLVETLFDKMFYICNFRNLKFYALEKLQIKTEWLSDYAKSFGISASRVAKLVETLFDKIFYICNFRNLKF